MILAGTGHRPDKLGGYGPVALDRLFALATAALRKHTPTRVISGMALGWDSALAFAALELQIPLTCAIPFEGQESRWPEKSQAWYRKVLAAAEHVHVVADGGYAVWKMQHRNEWMVDNCDTILALWNGTSGGTGNCIAYARSIQRPIINLWSCWEKYK